MKLLSSSTLQLVGTAALLVSSLSLGNALPNMPHGAQVAAAQLSCNNWAVGVSYNIGDCVTYGGSTWTCQIPHSAISPWAPMAGNALWQLVGDAPSSSALPVPTTTTTTTPARTTTTTTTPARTTTTTTTPAHTTTTTTTTTPARTTTTTTTTPARTSTTTKAATSTTTTTTTPARTTTTTSSAGPAPTGTLPTCHQAWVAVWTYQGGSIVSYNNVDFKNSFYANAGDEPTKSNNWVSLGPCDPNGMPDGPGRDGVPTLAQARAFEASQTSSDLFQKIKRSIATLDNSVVEQVAPGKASNPPNVKRVEQIIPQSKWNYYFSVANPLYTYTGFLQAVAKFTAFCGDYSDGRDANAICKRSLAAMFSHFAQETGGHSVQQYGIAEWLQALVAVRENGCPESPGCSYNNGCVDPVWNYIWTCGKNPDGSFMNYFGRGAKQLTYFFNYAPFSQIMFNGDPTVLLNDPDRVATSWLNLASAVFFFVYPQPPKPSMLFVVDGTWVPNADDISRQLGNDFPTTIQIINSECQDSPTKAAAQNRINYYRNFTADLGIDISHDNLKCAGMGLFSGQSSAALFIYWDKADSPFTCKLVNYQTAFNALIDDQYVSCVEHKWNVTLK